MLFSVVLAGLCPYQEAASVGLALTGAQGWQPPSFLSPAYIRLHSVTQASWQST